MEADKKWYVIHTYSDVYKRQAMILTIITKVGKRLSKILLLLTYTNQVLHSNQSLHLQLLRQESGN